MASQTIATEVLESNTIIDTDVHLSRGISVEDLARHLDDPHKNRVLAKGRYPDSTGSDWDPYMGGKIETRRLDSPRTIQEDLVEQFHVDHPILNTISGCTRLADSEFAAALMPANNNVILEKFLDPSEFYGLGVVTPQTPHRAAEEIDRIGDEKQIVGLFIETFAQDPPIGDPTYDPLYEAAEDNDLNIAFHGAAASGFKDDFPIQNRGLEKFLEVHTLAHPWQSMLAFVSILVQGIPVKFPELNFSFLESGISWVPYMMWRLDKEYSMRRSEAPLLEARPSEYVKDRFFFASQPLGEPGSPEQMEQMIDIIGADSIMFASDYPHWDFDSPDELGQYLDRTFSEEAQQKMLTDTPAEAFGITV